MGVDEALSSLGKFGRWQMIRYTLVCLSVTMSGCWHMMSIVFTGGEPEHHCKVPAGQTVNETIPLEGEGRHAKYSQCLKYVNLTVSNVTMKCDDGWYYEPEYDSTIVTEWDLVCNKNYLVETSQSVFNMGVMVGAVVFTSLADRVGRKPVHLGCQYAMIAVGLGIAYAPGYLTFVVLRFFLGAIREGAGLVGIVMACELFPAAQRTFAGTFLELYWAAAWMLLGLIAFLITHWRHLQLAVTIPPVLTVALIWLIPESVPWLAANGRYEEAELILQEAADYNGVQLPPGVLRRPDGTGEISSSPPPGDQPEANDAKVPLEPTEGDTAPPASLPKSQSKLQLRGGKVLAVVRGVCGGGGGRGARDAVPASSSSCMDLLRSRTMLLYTFTMCSVWFASGVIYFGLSLSTSTLAGDKYVNFFLSGAVEAPAYGMTVIVLQRYGRRWPLFVFHMIAGVVLFINIFLPEETESGIDLTPLIITLTMIGKFAMTAAFGTVVLYAPEIYPTNLRNLGFGMASVWGRIGGMIAPFASYIGKLVPWIPGLVFSVVAVVTGAMALLLPETLDRPLPDSIAEIENWKRSGGYKIDPTELKNNAEDVPEEKKDLIVRVKENSNSANETKL